jgi:hypothetical protein
MSNSQNSSPEQALNRSQSSILENIKQGFADFSPSMIEAGKELIRSESLKAEMVIDGFGGMR